ncbi:MAG: PEP-CTERM sorting domain-containing protein [Roseateles sp.]|uniref:PEP-CTERM sorting domain-containing protein n=1 Tax=Roseateles sp. TaxID=1971397 RepID=UPI0039EBC315
MNFTLKSTLAAAALLAGFAAQAATASIDLAGVGTGYAALANVKSATADRVDYAESWNFPYYLDASTGLLRSIAASPLSAGSDYSVITSSTVSGKDITADNFSSFSAGAISYDAASLTGVGTETIGAGALSIKLNATGFSPYTSGYNTGTGIGDFAFAYTMEVSNLTGKGLTFVNGQLSSIDLDASVAVSVQLGSLGFYFTESPTFTLNGARAQYTGTLSISGDHYAFDINQKKTVGSPLGTLSNTQFVMNREGSIGAVSPVPEPSTYALLAAGLALVGTAARRTRRRQA